MKSAERSSSVAWLSVVLFVCFAIAISVYGGAATQSKFVAWDDISLIYTNRIVQDISWANLQRAFTTYDPELYIPLTFLSYQIDYALGGLSAAVYHWHNLILHCFNSFLVCWALLLVTRDRFLSLLGGLLFAVHPLHTEAVLWASARKDVLSAFYFLLSVICYVSYRGKDDKEYKEYKDERGSLSSSSSSLSSSRRPRSILYALSLLFFLLGLLAKVSILILPVILLLIDWYEGRRVDRRMILEKIPFFVLSIVFGTIAMYGKANLTLEPTFLQKALMAGKSTVFYLGKLFWPPHLSPMYPYMEPIGFSSTFLIPGLLVLCLLGCSWLIRRRFKLATFGIFFFFVTLIPSFFNIVKADDIYVASDRYAYLPSVGIFLALTFALRALVHRMAHSWHRYAEPALFGLLSLFILATFASLSHAQAQIWRDSVTLFRHAIAEQPESFSAFVNLGIVERESGDVSSARSHFQSALAIHDIASVHINLAMVHEREGDLAQARKEYERAMAMDPMNPETYGGLGALAEREGMIDEAMTLYQRAIELNPYYVSVLNNLGTLLARKRAFGDAERLLRRAIGVQPTFADAHFNLGYVLRASERLTEALTEYKKAFALDPENADATALAGGILLKLGRLKEAASSLQQALRVDPQNVTALQLLSALRQSDHE